MSLSTLPILALDETLRYLDVPELARLSLTSRFLRYHAHPHLYRKAHDYCSCFKNNKSTSSGEKARFARLEATLAVKPEYFQFVRKHTAVRQNLFARLWKNKSESFSFDQLSFPWLETWDVRLVRALERRGPPAFSVKELTIVSTSGRDGEYRVTFLLLELLHLFQGLRKLTLDLQCRDPTKYKLDEFVEDADCPNLEHLVTIGTSSLYYMPEFFPNLKYYEVLHEGFEETPSEVEMWDFAHDMVTLFRLKKGGVMFRYGAHRPWSDILIMSHNDLAIYDHFPKLAPWLLESDYRISSLYSRQRGISDGYSLDLTAFDLQIRTRVLKTVNQLPFSHDIEKIRIDLTDEDTEPFAHILPINFSVLELEISQTFTLTPVIESTIKNLPQLRHLTIYFFALEDSDRSMQNEMHYEFPRYFFGKSHQFPRQIAAVEKDGSIVNFLDVDTYRFSIIDGWRAWKMQRSDETELYHPLPKEIPRFHEIEEKLKKLGSLNSRLVEVTAFFCVSGALE